MKIITRPETCFPATVKSATTLKKTPSQLLFKNFGKIIKYFYLQILELPAFSKEPFSVAAFNKRKLLSVEKREDI